jgi:antitoxin ParD1/3/4
MEAKIGAYTLDRADILKLVTVKLPEGLIKGLDDLVRQGMYPSRSSAIRAAVRDMLKRELWHIEAS